VVPRPELIDMKWFDAKTTDQQVRLKFNAYGKTPAFNVVITSRCVDINEMTPHGAPKDDNQAFAALGEAEAKLPKPGPLNPFSIIPAMASGDVLYQMPCIPFRSKQQIDDEGDELFALMIGSVFYDDIFGDQHHLTYCYQVGIDYDLKLYKIPDSHPPFPGKLYASNTAGATICPYFKSIIQ